MKLQKSFLIALLALLVGVTGCAKSGKGKGGISKAPGSEKSGVAEDGGGEGSELDDQIAAEEGETNYANGLADNTTPAGNVQPDVPAVPPEEDFEEVVEETPQHQQPIVEVTTPAAPVAAEVTTPTAPTAPTKPVMTIVEDVDGTTTTVATDDKGNKATITTTDPNSEVNINMNGQAAEVGSGTTSVTAGAPAVVANLTTPAVKCESLYDATSVDFAPGLTSKAATAPFTTWYKEGEINYTDSRGSGQIHVLTKKIDALPADVKAASKEIAKNISMVDIQFTGLLANVKFEYFKGQTRNEIYFYNIIEDIAKPVKQTKMTLKQVDKTGKDLPKAQVKFTAEVECLDKGTTCENIQLSVNEVDAAGKVKATAYVIQRSGPAQLMLEEAIVAGRATMTNVAQKEFAGFLTGTVINSCLAALKAHNDKRITLEECAVENLRKQCEGLERYQIAANTVKLSTWAAAYGRSWFELNFATNTKFNLTLMGPLMHQKTVRPMISKDMISLEEKFKDSLKSAEVFAQDGAGRLNFVLKFAGEPSADLRFNVITLAAPPK